MLYDEYRYSHTHTALEELPSTNYEWELLLSPEVIKGLLDLKVFVANALADYHNIKILIPNGFVRFKRNNHKQGLQPGGNIRIIGELKVGTRLILWRVDISRYILMDAIASDSDYLQHAILHNIVQNITNQLYKG